LPVLKRLEPSACFLPDALDIQPAKRRRATVEPPKGARKQRNRSYPVAPLMMMKGSGDLHDRLQEGFFRLSQREPHGFPMFVSFEELLRAIAQEAFIQRPGTPVEVSLHSQTVKAADGSAAL